MQDALAQQGESDLWVVGRPGRVVFVVLKRLGATDPWPGGLPKMDDGILDEKNVEVSWFMGVPLLSGDFTVCYWKWPFIVDFPINHGDFP